MKIKDIYGRDKNISLNKYLIKWDKPACSKFQTNIQNFLYIYWKNHIVTVEFRIPSSLLRCDIINWSKKIAIEADGGLHDKFSKHFHGTRSRFLNSFRRDIAKYKWIEEIMEFKLIRIIPKEVPLLSRQWFIDKHEIDII